MIYGARVRQARELRGEQQGEVASHIGISQSRLAQIERGEEAVHMDPETRQRLATRLRFPASFFERPAGPELPEGSMHHRARKTVPQYVVRRALREAEMAHEVAHLLLAHVDAPDVRVPGAQVNATVEESAALARASLGVPAEGPILRLLHVLERGGVLVYLVRTHVDRKLDGFSAWIGIHLERPVIVLADSLVWDRTRQTAAHELGHLVMHRAPRGDADVEAEANQFAGAFLMPREDALAVLPQPVTLGQLAPLKLTWGMSIQSLIMRARHVGLIDEDGVARLFKQLTSRGWRTLEPGSDARPVERPRGLRRMTELVYGPHSDLRPLSEKLGIYRGELVEMLDRYETAPRPRGQARRQVSPRDGAAVIRFPARQ
jgi:Zn-dependent peptidase ImmA (M78 family)/transcriptional regulator with XRE-family HTH domain